MATLVQHDKLMHRVPIKKSILCVLSLIKTRSEVIEIEKVFREREREP